MGWLPVALWLAAIWWQSSRPGGPAPINQDAWFVVTSLGHVVEYAGLGFLLGRLIGAGAGTTMWLGAWGLCVMWGLSDEFHQSFVPGRDVEMWDIGVDTVSSAGGLLACALLRRVRLLPRLLTHSETTERRW